MAEIAPPENPTPGGDHIARGAEIEKELKNPLVKRYAKAILGALTAGLVAAYTAASDGHITLLEGIGIALAIIAPGAVVARTNNAD